MTDEADSILKTSVTFADQFDLFHQKYKDWTAPLQAALQRFFADLNTVFLSEFNGSRRAFRMSNPRPLNWRAEWDTEIMYLTQQKGMDIVDVKKMLHKLEMINRKVRPPADFCSHNLIGPLVQLGLFVNDQAKKYIFVVVLFIA